MKLDLPQKNSDVEIEEVEVREGTVANTEVTEGIEEAMAEDNSLELKWVLKI